MNNRDANHDAVVVAAARTAVGRAKRGSLVTTRPDDLAADVIRGLLDRVDGLDPGEVDDGAGPFDQAPQ